MPKYYVESGRVALVLQAKSAKEAAIKAFQWSCDRQATIHAASPLQHIHIAERLGWQLEESIQVGERGFGQREARTFETLDIVAAWQGFAFPWTAPNTAAPGTILSHGG